MTDQTYVLNDPALIIPLYPYDIMAGDVITIAKVSIPPYISNLNTGAVNSLAIYTGSASKVGIHTITLSLTDSLFSVEYSFILTILAVAVNIPPTFSITPLADKIVHQGQTITYVLP